MAWANKVILVEEHRWELPVLCYHSIRGDYHYPFLGVIVSVILHYFIRQNYHKNQSDRYPFFLIMINYQIFPINYHILYFQMYSQYLSFLQKYPNNVSKTYNILQFLEQKFLQKRLFLIFRIVFNNIPSTFCTFFSLKCIFLYILILEHFLLTLTH